MSSDWQKAVHVGAVHRLKATLQGLEEGHLVVDVIEESMDTSVDPGRWAFTLRGDLLEDES